MGVYNIDDRVRVETRDQALKGGKVLDRIQKEPELSESAVEPWLAAQHARNINSVTLGDARVEIYEPSVEIFPLVAGAYEVGLGLESFF